MKRIKIWSIRASILVFLIVCCVKAVVLIKSQQGLQESTLESNRKINVWHQHIANDLTTVQQSKWLKSSKEQAEELLRTGVFEIGADRDN